MRAQRHCPGYRSALASSLAIIGLLFIASTANFAQQKAAPPAAGQPVAAAPPASQPVSSPSAAPVVASPNASNASGGWAVSDDGQEIVNTDLITLNVTLTDTYGRFVTGLDEGGFLRLRR
jgi:hypothetical protein